jgi:hypothetical protein
MPLFGGGIGAAVGGFLGNIGQSAVGQTASRFVGSAVGTLLGQTPNLAGATLGQGVIGGALAGGIGQQFLANELSKQFATKPAQQAVQQQASTGQQFFAPPGGTGPPQTFGAPGFLGAPPPGVRGGGPAFFGVPQTSFPNVPRGSFAAQQTNAPSLLASLGGGGGLPGTPVLGSSFAAPALGALGGLLGRGAASVGGVIARNPVISGTVGGVLAGEALDAFQNGGGTAFFRQTMSGARAIPLVMIPNPVTGAPTFFKHAGRPILFSGDLTAAKRVNKLAMRARRKR